MTDEQKLLNDAAEEIIRLRKQNEVMKIRLDVFDTMTAIVYARAPEKGYESSGRTDIVREIDKHLNENLDSLSSAVRAQVIKR